MTTAMYGEGGKTQDAQRKLMEFSRVAGQHVGCACVCVCDLFDSIGCGFYLSYLLY